MESASLPAAAITAKIRRITRAAAASLQAKSGDQPKQP